MSLLFIYAHRAILTMREPFPIRVTEHCDKPLNTLQKTAKLWLKWR
jgi:hypothetical protein